MFLVFTSIRRSRPVRGALDGSQCTLMATADPICAIECSISKKQCGLRQHQSSLEIFGTGKFGCQSNKNESTQSGRLLSGALYLVQSRWRRTQPLHWRLSSGLSAYMLSDGAPARWCGGDVAAVQRSTVTVGRTVGRRVVGEYRLCASAPSNIIASARRTRVAQVYVQ